LGKSLQALNLTLRYITEPPFIEIAVFEDLIQPLTRIRRWHLIPPFLPFCAPFLASTHNLFKP
jgi:hypothetical protein